MLLTILVALHLAATIACVAHLLLTYRSPAGAAAWICAIALLPLVGVVLYVTLAVFESSVGIRRRRRAGARLRDERDQEDGELDAYDDELVAAGFPRLMRATSSLAMTSGNAIVLIDDDAAALDRQLDAIAAAREEVLLQTYVLKPGKTFARLVDVARDRVAAGVRVRILFDPIGSSDLPRAARRQLRSFGIDAVSFLQPNPFKGRFQINFRNHRKILCVDGSVAFTGGRNWADEYFGRTPGPTFRDTTFELQGPIVWALRRLFMEDWAVATGSGLSPEAPRTTPERRGDMFARALPAGPDEPTDNLVTVLSGAFRAARDSILIVTPYFVPGPSLANALNVASLSGVDVRILMPEKTDDRTVNLASRYYMAGLLAAGGHVHLRPPPLLHSKAIIIDDRWSTVGSVNLDCRSVELNYELNLEVPGRAFAAELRRYFAPDLAAAAQVDPEEFAARGAMQRLTERAAALFSPIL